MKTLEDLIVSTVKMMSASPNGRWYAFQIDNHILAVQPLVKIYKSITDSNIDGDSWYSNEILKFEDLVRETEKLKLTSKSVEFEFEDVILQTFPELKIYNK